MGQSMPGSLTVNIDSSALQCFSVGKCRDCVVIQSSIVV